MNSMKHLMRKQDGAAPDTGRSDPVRVGDEIPLTPTQLGMLYESTLSEKPWVNLEQVVCHLDDEAIDPAAMLAAWQRVTDQHAALRMALEWASRPQPVQVVYENVSPDLTITDWSAQSAERHNAALRDWLATDRLSGAELQMAPSWRVNWFILGPRRSVLVWTVHHVLLDGRSMATVLEQMFEHYAALQTAALPAIAADGPSFADHCRAVAALDPTESEAHFQKLLAGFDAPNVISLAPAPQAVAMPRNQVVEHAVSQPITARLDARAKSAGVTVATLVLAAWGIVLARCSGRDDAVFGVTRSGRNLLPGSQAMVGCLINTLPVRLRLSPGTSVDAMLKTLRRDQIALRPHEHASLADVMQWSDLPDRATLFGSLVMYERWSMNQHLRSRGGLWANRRFEVLEEGALPLTLAAYHDDVLELRLEHDPAQFSTTTAQRLLGYVARTLTALVETPGAAPAAVLDMLGPDEVADLLMLGHPEGMPMPAPVACVATLFETQVAAHPDAIAVAQVGSAAPLSYAALDEQANRLAHVLVAQGVGTGDLVSICLPRSPEFILAILAVMKAGAAYLPLDPTYPAEAITGMIGDSASTLLISSTQAAPKAVGVKTLLLDKLAKQLAKAATTAPPRAAFDPERLAYVIYTSGSTGAPKGVMIPQRALVSHAAAITACYGLTAADRVLQFASLSFDVSIEEIIPTLLAGATLVMRNKEMAESIPDLLDAVALHRLTILNLPTAFWHVLVDHMASSGAVLPPSVRLMIVGGERVSPHSLGIWQGLAPELRWLNGYGPTEATITCTIYEATRPKMPKTDVPIGRPLGHATSYVLLPDRSLAPRGVAGELWVGGQAVALGYLGRADLTAERFVTDPFAFADMREGALMYRTGDMVLWQGDRNLAFLGRTDRQVKLRGYRIELRDIELALENHPSVGRALATVEGAGADAARLIAWVAPANQGGSIDLADLRKSMTARLPAHMLPAIVPLTEFPQTPGGKIDLARLPRPAAEVKTAVKPGASDATTTRMRKIFAGILGQSAVDADASFFDLGGHSLLAIRLIGTIEAEFGQRLSVTALHAAPTPRLLSRQLRTAEPVDAGSQCIVPIQPHGSRPPLYGVHVLGLNAAYYRPLSEQLGPDQPIFGLTVGLLTPQTPTGVRETAEFYFNEIQAHQPTGPLSLSAVSLGSYVAFELAQQLLAAGRDVLVLALFDAEGPGGRVSLRSGARRRAHFAKLRVEGPKYLLHGLHHKLDDLRNWAEKTRMLWADKLGQPRKLTLTIENFVAANELAIQSYVAKPYPRRLTVFRALGNVFDSPESIANGLGWKQVATGGLDLIEVPGGHLSILEPPSVEYLAQELQAAIDKAIADR